MLVDTLESERLRIIPFSIRHITERHISWLNDPVVVKYSKQRHTTHNKDTCISYLDSFVNTPNYYWAIEVKNKEPSHIGSITAFVDYNNSVADIGIMIGDTFEWGKGFGKEAFSIVINWMLDEKKIHKVTAGTMRTNIGMLKVMMSIGMKEECCIKDYYIVDDSSVDLIKATIS